MLSRTPASVQPCRGNLTGACLAVIASAGSLLPAGKVAVFYVLRAALAVTSAYSEARLVR